jgi:hypothetical protein
MPVCAAPECPEPPALQWTRWAREEELTWLKEHGEIGPGDTEAQMPIYACDAHKISAELASSTHDAPCTAPPECTCSVGQGAG